VDEAMAIIDEVDSMGGMIKAIESGMAKLKIEESATKKQVLLRAHAFLLPEQLCDNTYVRTHIHTYIHTSI
jgi:hypothetical protein